MVICRTVFGITFEEDIDILYELATMSTIFSALQRATEEGASRLKYLFNKRPVVCQCPNRVEGKVAIITGATSGIGYYTALDLAKKGSILYLGCRNPKTGRKTTEELRKLSGNQDVYYLNLDLSKVSSIKNFVKTFKKKEKSLDILVNNAGIFHQPSTVTDDGFEITFQTNYLGPFLLTTLLLDYTLKSHSPRIVFVSSEAHRLVTTDDLVNFSYKEPAKTDSFMDFVHVYGISKLAVNVYADYISKNNPAVLVLLVNPGNVWTSIYKNCWTSWWELPTRLKCAFFMRDPTEGAQSTIHAVNAGTVLSRKYITDTLGTEDLEHYSAEVSIISIATSKELLGV